MEKVFTNLEHAAWLREQARLKRPYWYGTYYLECTQELLDKKKAQYPEHYGEGRMAKYLADIEKGQICGDCVNGAVKGAVWSELGRRKPVYKSHDCPDKSADGMFEYCKSIGMAWGGMENMPDRIGLAVRMSGHVGVYVGNGEVVEWRGFAHGCVTTKLAERRWLHWYELPWTEYVEGELPETSGSGEADVQPVLRRGAKGSAVTALQERLKLLGYDLGEWGADGEFGAKTEEAVKAFQTAAGLTADGIAGERTLAALAAAVESMGAKEALRVRAGTWNVRTAPGTQYEAVGTVKGGDKLPVVDAEGWVPVVFEGAVRWISGKAVET